MKTRFVLALPFAALLLSAAAPASAQTSTTPVRLDVPGGDVTVDAVGTRVVSGASVNANDISTYDIGFNPDGASLFAAFAVDRYNTLTLGAGSIIRQTIAGPDQFTFAALLLTRAGTTTIDGGVVQLNASGGARGPALLSSTGTSLSTINLRSGAINLNTGTAGVSLTAVRLEGSGTNFVMTGGSINDLSGNNQLLNLSGGARFTYAGGQLNSAIDNPIVGVADTGTINLFGSGFRLNNAFDLADGTYTFGTQATGPNGFPFGVFNLSGSLLDGTAASFLVASEFNGTTTTLNVNVRTPPTIPDPASLAAVGLGGLALLRRRHRA